MTGTDFATQKHHSFDSHLSSEQLATGDCGQGELSQSVILKKQGCKTALKLAGKLSSCACKRWFIKEAIFLK